MTSHKPEGTYLQGEGTYTYECDKLHCIFCQSTKTIHRVEMPAMMVITDKYIPRISKLYTDKEITYMRENPKMTHSQMALVLNRSEPSIKSARYKFVGLRQYKQRRVNLHYMNYQMF